MATDHGFNVGLPDNLGMFYVLSSIHCVYFSNQTLLENIVFVTSLPAKDTLIFLIFNVNEEY